MSLRLTREQYEGLRALAEKEHRSVAAQIRLLIDQATTERKPA